MLLCLARTPARLPALVELAPSFVPTVVSQLEALVEAYKGVGVCVCAGVGRPLYLSWTQYYISKV